MLSGYNLSWDKKLQMVLPITITIGKLLFHLCQIGVFQTLFVFSGFKSLKLIAKPSQRKNY